MAGVAGGRPDRSAVITYLIDTSAIWRLLRDDQVRARWQEQVEIGAVGSCEPQRIEFRRSARNQDEYEEYQSMLGTLFPDVGVPKDVWRWIEAAQFRLAGVGALRALSPVDLLLCGTAAHHQLTILHDDRDFETAAAHLKEVSALRVMP